MVRKNGCPHFWLVLTLIAKLQCWKSIWGSVCFTYRNYLITLKCCIVNEVMRFIVSIMQKKKH